MKNGSKTKTNTYMFKIQDGFSRTTLIFPDAFEQEFDAAGGSQCPRRR